MFESLYTKTFAILGSQILITWLTTLVLIVVARWLYYAKKFEFTATESETGEIDIHIPWEDIATPSIFIFFLQFFIGLGLIYWGKDQDISISFIWFSIWSVLTGTLLGIYLLLRNENHGSKALGITVIITHIAGLIGTYPGVNLLPLGPFFCGVNVSIFWIYNSPYSWPSPSQKAGYIWHFDLHRVSPLRFQPLSHIERSTRRQQLESCNGFINTDIHKFYKTYFRYFRDYFGDFFVGDHGGITPPFSKRRLYASGSTKENGT